MKNLKISAKIMLGYGVIILLMLIFVFIVIFTNTGTISNVNEIHADSNLQTMTKNLLASFYGARVDASTIYIKNDDDAYNRVLSGLDEVHERAQEIYDFIDANPDAKEFSGSVDSVVSLVDQWEQKVGAVQEANKTVDQITDTAYESQISLTSQSTGILNYQLELSRDEASQELEESQRLRRIDRLEFGAELSKNIDYIGSSFEVILTSYDLSRVPESKQVLEDTVAELEEFLADSSLQYNIDTATALLQALDVYNQDIDSFIEMYNTRETLITDARSTGTQTLNAINSLLDEIDTATGTLVETTSSSASGSLVVVIIIAAIAFIFAVVFALLLSKMISRPIKIMHGVIDQVGLSGDLNFSPQTMEELSAEAQSKDELGQSMRSFTTLINHLSKTGEELSHIAQGDLSMDVQLLSESDTIGAALKNMLMNLNRMFKEVQTSTEQVSEGAKQIADGAQALAQGSTEQAASVQQLSSTISEISIKTKENADMAASAADLGNTIKGNAEKGSEQMEQMMQAVKDINDASQSINDVIKVIDDIAFQTNILALNAAVEAARAGQHGKGFAVVAEEVRSLAAKSAEAAKDTGSLIADSMEKTQLGSHIAGATAESLAEIVSGINQSSRIVKDIARSSEEQSAAITEINKGIDQVAQVVQHNSATSEESAAASQQMSGQSAMLVELISQFKLKGSSDFGSSSALPGAKARPEILATTGGGLRDGFGKY